MSSSSSNSSSSGQLLVDFPTRRRHPTATVSFAPQVTVHPIRSTLTMISDKQELWYSKSDVNGMKFERNSDASALRRTLLSPSAADLQERGIHVSHAIGLEMTVNPIEAKSKLKIFLSMHSCRSTSTSNTSSHPRPTFFAQSLSLSECTMTMQLHRMAVLRLQEVKDEEELCQISQKLSSCSSARARALAKAWVALDILDSQYL
jgi:hypothetical protein